MWEVGENHVDVRCMKRSGFATTLTWVYRTGYLDGHKSARIENQNSPYESADPDLRDEFRGATAQPRYTACSLMLCLGQMAEWLKALVC